jgi:hypothetical protein
VAVPAAPEGQSFGRCGTRRAHDPRALAAGVRECDEPQARRFECALPTPIGILQEPGHQDPWSVAMDCPPTRARVLDDGAR